MSVATPELSPQAIAVLADAHLRQQRIRTLLTEAGYQVAICTAPDRLNTALLGSHSVQLWVVEADLDDCPEHVRDALIDTPAVAVLFNEAPDCERQEPEYAAWEQRLLDSVARCLSQAAFTHTIDPVQVDTVSLDKASADSQTYRQPPDRQTSGNHSFAGPLSLPPLLQRQQPARHQLWILAASLGGPVAVNRFLACLPAGLPCTFLYAQHIHAEFQSELLSSAARHTKLRLTTLEPYTLPELGTIYLVPVEHSLAIVQVNQKNQLQITDQPWRRPYSPCLDELMETMVQGFQGDCHAIVFSGMTGDALLGSCAIRSSGGEVWVQEADNCIQPAMPNAVRDAGYCTGQGSPAALAQGLLHHLQTQTENATA